jgi:DUF438 domain-containing protein
MELNEQSKIVPLMDKYPKVYEEIFKLNSKVKRLKNPIVRKAIGMNATLETASKMLKIPLEELISTIKNAIDLSGGEKSAKDRKEMLKKLLQDMHKGVDIEILKSRFKEAVGDISSAEIGKLEQQLIDDGFLKIEEISKLSDLHVELFRDVLDVKPDYVTIPGHPIHTYLQENLEIANRIRRIRSAPEENKLELFCDLMKVDIHYARKENQIFPILERNGISGPPQVMWAVHDEIREILKTGKSEDIESALKKVEDMIYKEEHILFPLTLETFKESDWIDVQKGEEEIGFIFGVKPGNEWKPSTAEDIHAPQPLSTTIAEGTLNLNIGNLTLEQVNVMLKTLPVDLTFVNEKDEVAYYSDTEDRIFPRSRGIIGRKVQNCHPPQSIHVVENILNKFKSGAKDMAEFWIQMGGQFILIRYYAMRDDNGNYVGTLEVSQELTRLREIDGERRLLQWDK